MNQFMNGSIKLNLDDKVSECGKCIDDVINESETLENLTHEQKVEIANIVHMEMLSKFSDFELKIYAEDK